jgi:DNA-binding NarL/FixJ family response regulator
MKKISVLLVEDHVVVREGLRSLVSVEDDIEVVGEAGDGRLGVKMARELTPDVVVMDIAMPLLNGLDATRQIIDEGIQTKVLILSSYADDEYVHRLTEAGAAGYLIKQTAASELIKAVREIANGNAYFTPSILKRLLGRYKESSQRGQVGGVRPTEHLTSREREVLQMVAEGHVNKEIAATLYLSVKTVEKHRQQLMDKLSIHDVASLTRYAIANGFVECPESVGAPAHANTLLEEPEPKAAPPKPAARSKAGPVQVRAVFTASSSRQP